MEKVLISTVAAFSVFSAGASFAGEKVKNTDNAKQEVSSTFDGNENTRGFFGFTPLTDEQVRFQFEDQSNRE